MNETLFTTSIPIYIFIVFMVGICLVGLEISTNTKGVLACFGGFCLVVGIMLCGISGVSTIEITFLLVVSSIIIMLMLNNADNKSTLLNSDKVEKSCEQKALANDTIKHDNVLSTDATENSEQINLTDVNRSEVNDVI